MITAILLLSLLNLGGTPQYKITNLGVVDGDYSVATDINNQGDIVGYYVSSVPGYHPQAFLYTCEMVDISSSPYNPSYSYAAGINESGQVALYMSFGRSVHSFMYDTPSRGDLIDLNIPFGEGYGYAADINDNVHIVGRAQGTAWLWDDGTTVDIGSFGYHASSEAINNLGQITGSAEVEFDGAANAFLYADGQMIDLGIRGIGTDINDLGEVVGHGSLDKDYYLEGFLYSNGDIIDVNPSGVHDTWVYGINNRGQIVGKSGSPFVWENGRLQNLNDMIEFVDTEIGYVSSVYAINDVGQMVGSGHLKGATHYHSRAVLLTPITCVGDTNYDGVVDMEDLSDLIGHWGQCTGYTSNYRFDFDEDRWITAKDLAQALGHFGVCP